MLSYLPLCHIAERLITVINGDQRRLHSKFRRRRCGFTNDLREVQPTFFWCPRVWEKMLASVQVRMNDASWLKRRNYQYWTSKGSRLAKARMSGRLGVGDRVVGVLGWLMLYRALRERLGMSRCQNALSGAAPIAPQILDWFWSIGYRFGRDTDRPRTARKRQSTLRRVCGSAQWGSPSPEQKSALQKMVKSSPEGRERSLVTTRTRKQLRRQSMPKAGCTR